MANNVSIGVSATLDASEIEARINALGRKVAEAGKVQFNPVSVKTIDQVSQLEKKFQQLLKVHGELARRMKATGQEGRGLSGADFDAMFPDAAARNKQLQKVLTYTLGQGAFTAMPIPGGGGGGAVPPAPPRQPAPSGGGGVPGMVVNTVQAGLRAAGPMGGVAANSLGTSMSAGFGAGLMGLLGGLLAMGVGKLVSGVMEKVGQAEDNNVAMDRLKRTLGDVNISFDALKTVVNGSAEGLKITYAEAGKLGQQFAQLANMKGDQYTSLVDELGTGVGLARSFGLDPEQGVGVMGQMRGIGVTRDTQDSKRFALLIGETIAKSDAFAKAGEVMDALGSFAVSQTRTNMSAANVQGYAGMFSSMVGSGIPGLDPAGAASMLGRINAALSAGGAKGEASQFFTGMLGSRMGLNPYQTRMFREGGAFATADSMFGSGSAYARYKGKAGPGGSQTMLQMTLEQLRRQYGEGSDELADATANHLGIGINQAMALLTLKPKQMGEMGKYANLTDLNAAGIGNLSKVLYGSDAERKGVADSLMRRKDVTGDEKGRIKTAMESGDSETQKRVLAEIVAQRDQEQTTGKDIRDSKNALDNIKTSIADKLVPYFNEARMGIMAIAGVGKEKGVTTDSIMRGVIEANSKSRRDAIEGQFAPEESRLRQRRDRAVGMSRISDVTLMEVYRTDPQRAEQMRRDRDNAAKEIAEVDKRLAEIGKEKAALLEKENSARKREIDDLDKAAAKRMEQELSGPNDPETTGSITPTGYHPLGQGGAGAGRGSGADLRRMDYGPVDPGRKDEAMKYFMGQGWTKEQAAGLVANLWAESKMRERAVGDGGQAVGIAQWHPDRQREFEKWKGKSLRDASFQEQLEFVQYELTQGREQAAGARLRRAGTAGEAGATVSRYYERPLLADSEAANRGALAGQIASGTVQVEVIHKNERGQEIAPRQYAQTRLQNNWRNSPVGH